MQKELHQIHDILSQAIGASRYEMWVKPAKIQLSSIWVNLFAENRFVYERLCSLQGKMELALRQAFPQYSFRILPPSSQEDLSSLSFIDRFIAGPENKFIASLLKNLSTQPHWEYGSLFIYGEKGMGKSHFLKTLANARRKAFPQEKVLLFTGAEFLEKLQDSFSSGKSPSLFLEASALLVDEMVLKKELPLQQAFLKILREFTEKKRPLVITSHAPLHSFYFSSPALQSRLSQGISCRMDPPALETRLAIVCSHFPQAIDLSKEVLLHLCENFKAPDLLLEAMKNLVKSGKENISLEEVTKISDVPLRKQACLPSEILKEVATYFDVSLDELACRKQRRNVTRARKIATYLMHKKLHLSYGEIQNCFESASQATLRGYCRQVEGELPGDEEISRQIQDLCHKLSLQE